MNKKRGKKRSFLNKIWWGGDIGIWKKIGKNAKPKIPMPSFNCYVCWEKLNDILTLWRKTEKAHTRNVSFGRYCNSQSVAFLLTLFLIGRKAKPWQSRPFCTLSLSQRVVWLTHFRKLWTMSMWGLPKNKKKKGRVSLVTVVYFDQYKDLKIPFIEKNRMMSSLNFSTRP